MEKLIVILGICLLILGIILAILMISIIIMQKSGKLYSNNRAVFDDTAAKQVNNDELIAVITAAISMFYINESGIVPLFRVKSIKKLIGDKKCVNLK